MSSTTSRMLIPMLVCLSLSCFQKGGSESIAERDARMQWWREARFGLFIHWGLYAIPAGEWKGKKEYGEWIRHRAEIPLDEYDRFVGQFNPIQFDADVWVRMAKEAGMKYIVITSKHHDGFGLFDSKETDFDIMATPFGRDVLKELSEACKKEGIRLCFYHSIMDWHHPDYLPRRDWEESTRPVAGADFDRYVQYMKRQLRELLTNYDDIGVLWFDGEWESTWNEKYGREIYDYVRGLQPEIIVNNRVGAGRAGMEGMTKEGAFGGDFGTPEQEIPSTGLPGVDWESCMTMNSNWGYNKYDDRWKSAKDLIRMLTDIASKGGNYLLNVGPTAEGTFPEESVRRLREIGEWMRVNGESIHGTKASPFRNLTWGRATTKQLNATTLLYLHIFDWPKDGILNLEGLLNDPKGVYFLADKNKKQLESNKLENGIQIDVGRNAPDSMNTVVVLEVEGIPEVAHPPTISAEHDIFLDTLSVALSTSVTGGEIHFTLDGKVPTLNSPSADGKVIFEKTSTISAQVFLNGKPVSPIAHSLFTKVIPRTPSTIHNVQPGVRFGYYEGEWNVLPDFRKLKPIKSGTLSNFTFTPRIQQERFGFAYEGFIQIPADGIYTFSTKSDDGSALYIANERVVLNDGKHSMREQEGTVALAAGYHPIRVLYFELTGGDGLTVSISGPGIKKKSIDDSMLYHVKADAN